MPSGPEHRDINYNALKIIMIIVLLAALVSKQPLIVSIVLGFLWATLAVHPDLDQAEDIKGTKFARAWRFYWYPYGRLFPHRHPLSHWPFLSTAVRKVYFSPLIICIDLIYIGVHLAELKDDNFITFIQNIWIHSPVMRRYWHYWFFVGESLADGIHFAMDLVTTDIKQESKKI